MSHDEHPHPPERPTPDAEPPESTGDEAAQSSPGTEAADSERARWDTLFAEGERWTSPYGPAGDQPTGAEETVPQAQEPDPQDPPAPQQPPTEPQSLPAAFSGADASMAGASPEREDEDPQSTADTRAMPSAMAPGIAGTQGGGTAEDPAPVGGASMAAAGGASANGKGGGKAASPKKSADDSKGRGGKIALFSGLGVVAVAGLAYVAAALFTGGSAVDGATVAGVDIGGQSQDEVLATLEDQLGSKDGETLTMMARDKQAEVTPADLGLGVDLPATAESAAGTSWNPVIIWNRLTGPTEVEPVLTVAEDYPERLGEYYEGLSEEPVDAGIVYDGTTPETTPATTGFAVDAEAAPDALRDGWLASDGTFELPSTDAAPAVDDATAESVLGEVAEPAVSDPVVIDVDGQDMEISPEAIAQSLSFEPGEGTLAPVIDAKVLRDRAMEENPEIEDSSVDASFEFTDGKPVVVPSEEGLTVDGDDLSEQVSTAMLSADRTGSLEMKVSEPNFTTEDAENMDVSDTVSEFSTPYNSEPNRDTNLRVASEKVTGVVLQPGQTFSLNDTLGERTAANGYKSAGVIADGQMKKDFGGGVSQVSTTLFNAAFFAGFQLDEHQAHSRYISRYPEGRETTLDWTSIDLKFTNTSETPVVMHMYLSGGEVHAEMLGVKTVDVEADKSGRFAFTSGTTINESGAGCTPQAPQQGWSVTIYRTIKKAGTDEVISKDEYTTTYRPVNRVVCGGDD